MTKDEAIEVERKMFDAWFEREYPNREDRQQKFRMSSVRDLMLAAYSAGRAPTSEAVADRRRCKPCGATRGGAHCWKCGTETFEPHPSCGDDPRLPPIERIRELAKEVGYAIGVHGSLQRDLDVIAAPWTDMAIGNHALLEHIAAGLATDNGPAHIISTERKPLGRYAATIQMDGWYKQLDISVCPNSVYAAIPVAQPAADPAPVPAPGIDHACPKDTPYGPATCGACFESNSPEIEGIGIDHANHSNNSSSSVPAKPRTPLSYACASCYGSGIDVAGKPCACNCLHSAHHRNAIADNSKLAEGERAAFEAWAPEWFGKLKRCDEPGAEQEYMYSQAQAAWLAWQARGQQAGVPVGCIKCPRDPAKVCGYCGWDLAAAAPGEAG